MSQISDLIKRIESLLAAHEQLFLAARTTLEMAEPVDDGESVIHPEVLEDLQTAYLKVYHERRERGCS